MKRLVPAIQRAYELAGTGEFYSAVAVKEALIREGYDRRAVEINLNGETLARALERACGQAHWEPRRPFIRPFSNATWKLRRTSS